ncbi:hypothetical protein R9C00_10120 [Flammeovirgaceae bacterium SG7u.111]|nr:hypothetical protein [Flammeovirgaceae bacterium SG7u.132]WPO37808.1 hypothetical protein R9C00_10120 [Flammeovirgaceae bacterium SG7u.111]
MLDREGCFTDVGLIKVAGYAPNSRVMSATTGQLFIKLAGDGINSAGDVAKGTGYYMRSAGDAIIGAGGLIIFFLM